METLDYTKFSVITPVYNSFKLMERYFKCFEEQQYKNFELLIVDDCSTDDSFEELVKYKMKSALDIKIFKTSINSGPGVARNLGLKNAKGKWITFVDNDDWVSAVFFRKLIEIIENNENIDCLIYDLYKVYGKKMIKNKSVYELKGGYISIKEAIMNTTNHVVGKVYKRQVCTLNNINFPDLRRCEDVVYTTLMLSNCKTIYYLQSNLYYYLQRSESLSNNYQNMDESEMIQAFKIIYNNLENIYPLEVKEKSVRDLVYGVVLMMCKSHKATSYIEKYIEEYENIYPNWFQCKMVYKVGKFKLLFLYFIKYRFIFGVRILSLCHSLGIKLSIRR